MSKIIVIGGGDHAKQIISIINKLDDYTIIGYTDTNDKGDILTVKHLGNDSVLEEVKDTHKDCSAIIAIGMSTLYDMAKRVKLEEKLDMIGFVQPAIVSPDAVVNEDVRIGKGTVIFDGVVINSGSKIGKCVSINTNSSLDHDCNIEDHVFISPGVTICGGAVIGSKSFIGPGATITKYINIADNCIIGAGAVLIDNCLKTGKYFGVPARWVE